jgi:hypothetical protein
LGAEQFKPLPIVQFTDQESIEQALVEADLQVNDAPISERQLQALRTATARFLWLYYGESTCDKYIEWKRENGCELILTATMLGQNGGREGYEFYFRRPVPEDLSGEQLYREIWKANRTCCGGKNHARGMASSRSGVIIRTAHLTSVQPRLLEPIQGELPPEVWQGGRVLCCRTWWTQPFTIENQPPNARILAAYFAAVLEFDDGSHRPVLLHWLWDDRLTRWHLSAVNVMNTDDREVIGLEY